jgi:hypothetical protein
MTNVKMSKIKKQVFKEELSHLLFEIHLEFLI